MTRERDKADSITIESKPGSDTEVGGSLELAGDVVATIAGVAARQVKGIHSLGKSRLISFGDDPKRGVGAEVGKTEAALDLDVVIDYGVDIAEVVAELRRKTAEVVFKMAGRKVVEVNVHVVGVHLEEEEPPPAKPRVM